MQCNLVLNLKNRSPVTHPKRKSLLPPVRILFWDISKLCPEKLNTIDLLTFFYAINLFVGAFLIKKTFFNNFLINFFKGSLENFKTFFLRDKALNDIFLNNWIFLTRPNNMRWKIIIYS